MNKKVAVILVNYKEYANKYLKDCLNGIRSQDFSNDLKLYIVDNETSDKTFEYLKQEAPEAEIVRNIKNDGFAKGNNDAMKLAINSGYEYVVLLNMDAVAEKSAISELVKAADSNDSIASVQSRLMLYDEKDKINSVGNETHFLGFGYCRGYNDLYEESKVKNLSNIFYPSGAAVLFKASALKKSGLFDEDYFMYNEDQDIAWRIWLSGGLCVLAKDSIVYHKYEFSRSIKKYYFMDKNRIITCLKNYKIVTLLVFFPAFIIMELGLFYFAIKNKWLKEKIRVWSLFFSFNFWAYITRKRAEVKKIRVVRDSYILRMAKGSIFYQEISSPLLSFANFFLNIYFLLARFILKTFKI